MTTHNEAMPRLPHRFFPILLLLLGLVAPSDGRGQTLECSWSPPPGDVFPSHVHVVATVVVANLSDDNGDGVTDALDIPDLVFPSIDTTAPGLDAAVIRIVDGRCNGDGTMTQLASLGRFDPASMGNVKSSAIAVGNLHPAAATTERAPELVVVTNEGLIVTWTRTSDDATSWSPWWVSTSTVSTSVGAQPSIADLDGDGSAEVIVGRSIFDGQTGALIWSGTGGEGSDGFGSVTVAADWDLDGAQDVVDGQGVFDVNGSSIISYPIPDGYPAVANFDADDLPELVHSSGGVVRVLDTSGLELMSVSVPGGGRAGPPTIADFDGDGAPEIGVVGQSSYAVMDLECLDLPLPAECASTGVRWSLAIQEGSSGGQSSAAFDLDGDGAAEIAFLDEAFLRILSGLDGQVLFSSPRSTITWLQYPTLADIDDDGISELVVPRGADSSFGGVEIWSDTGWAASRGSWNQYSYTVTNVDDAGQVPAEPAPHWLEPGLNGFRAQLLPEPCRTAGLMLGAGLLLGLTTRRATRHRRHR